MFGKGFNILQCSLMIISSQMTGHSYSTIEEYFSDDTFNLLIFLVNLFLDIFFTELVNVTFTLNHTFIEAFEPEEIARESSLLMNNMIEDDLNNIDNLNNKEILSEINNENMMARTLQSLQTTFNTTFNRTNDATLNLDKSKMN